LFAPSFTLGLRSGTGGNVITKPMAITVQGVNTDNGGNGGKGGKGGEKGGGGGSTGPISLLTLVICGLVRRLKMSR